jgi:hypothetical protein
MGLIVMLNGLKKINLAFILENLGSWEGEKNYIYSLLSALNHFQKKTIKVKIITSKNNAQYLEKLNLSNINIIQSNFLSEKTFLNLLRKVSGKIFKYYDPIILYFKKKYKIDLISHYRPTYFTKTICWLPDFQHYHYPENFIKKEIKRRNNLYENIIDNSNLVLLSSNDSIKDLKKFKKNKRINYKKLNFTPYINFNLLKKNIIQKKYNIKKNYFIVPNQFWKHKNHICLVNAINFIKKNKINFQIILTGDKKSQFDSSVFNEFIKEIKKNKLQDVFSYLGKVPYHDLINLIYNSQAVINPSYFEGWSTIVEEAKILNKHIILSNIKVHVEQKPQKSFYFNPNDPKKLSKILVKLSRKKLNIIDKNNLNSNFTIKRKLFANNFVKIVNYVHYRLR